MSAAQQMEPSEKARIRSLPIEFWPEADRKAWISACQPSQRLKRGGAGSHMKPITLDDLARRYGYFLDFMNRRGLLDPSEGSRRPCHAGERRRLFGGTDRPRRLGDGSGIDLQAATGLRTDRSRPRPVLARRHRKGPRFGDAATFEGRPLGADGSPGRGRPDLDRRG